MRAHQILALFSLASTMLLFAVACEHTADYPPMKEPLKLKDGTTVSTQRLEHGREQYTLYCRPCHGEKGDGRGPAGIGLRPPPRNFTTKHANGDEYNLVFKFGGVEAGSLPPDSELKRIVKKGLHGTAMLPWAVPDNQLDDILQYIKTFNPIWTSDDVAKPIEITPDPWKGKEEEGVKHGKVVYHGLAQCLKCHPAYATRQEIWDAVKESTGEGSTSAFREDMYNPDAKLSEAYRVKLLPPDFTRHDVKAGTTPEDLFRTIASGIGGTAMPMWKGSIEDPDIWAIAHYVSSLIQIRDTPAAAELRKKLVEQPAWTPPAEGGAEGAAPEEKPAEKPAEKGKKK
jgi:mono/diheme cytochrome c family protein